MGFSSCSSRALLLQGMWALPRPRMEPMSPALARGFLTTAAPGKSHPLFLPIVLLGTQAFFLSCLLSKVGFTYRTWWGGFRTHVAARLKVLTLWPWTEESAGLWLRGWYALVGILDQPPGRLLLDQPPPRAAPSSASPSALMLQMWASHMHAGPDVLPAGERQKEMHPLSSHLTDTDGVGRVSFIPGHLACTGWGLGSQSL